MSTYDFIIAGGGVAGLSLAYRMVTSRLRGHSILIAEREVKDHYECTWRYWTDQPTHLDHLVFRSWNQVEFVSDTFQDSYDLRPYRYCAIHGNDFYRGMHEALSSIAEVILYKGRVNEITETKDHTGAQVIIDEVPQGARWAFDSTYKLADLFNGPRAYHYLKRHFKGWEIETPGDCFDPRTVTLYDFRTPQKGALRYFSVLPYTRRRALVEYVNISADLLKPHEYDRAIAEYLENERKIPQYRTGSIQTGVIPLTNRPIRRKLGESIMAIGTRGGLVKPSTGDAFQRIQADSLAVVDSLTGTGTPFNIPVPSLRYRIYDAFALQVLHYRGDQMKSLLTRLFKENTIQQILQFFDETAPLEANMRLFHSLPARPFLNAIFRVK